MENSHSESDGLEVNFNEETGEIQLDWDPTDPNWSWLNGLTSEQVGDIISEYLKHRLDDLELNDTESPA